MGRDLLAFIKHERFSIKTDSNRVHHFPQMIGDTYRQPPAAAQPPLSPRGVYAVSE
jgi:hypothetical protein